MIESGTVWSRQWRGHHRRPGPETIRALTLVPITEEPQVLRSFSNDDVLKAAKSSFSLKLQGGSPQIHTSGVRFKLRASPDLAVPGAKLTVVLLSQARSLDAAG